MSGSFYGTTEWRKVRAKALARDGHACTFCGAGVRGKGMAHVDHIIRRKLRPDLALELSNLQTLCQRCHDSTKKIMEVNAHKDEINSDGYPPDWA